MIRIMYKVVFSINRGGEPHSKFSAETPMSARFYASSGSTDALFVRIWALSFFYFSFVRSGSVLSPRSLPTWRGIEVDRLRGWQEFRNSAVSSGSDFPLF